MYTGQIVFSQLMDFLPRYEFNQCVSRYQGNYRLRKFSCLDQFLCMAFAQLTYRESLRDIQTCLRALQPKLYHAGIRGKVSRSTLADANESRDWRIYADFAQVLIRIARTLYAEEDFDRSIPCFIHITEGKTHDVNILDKSSASADRMPSTPARSISVFRSSLGLGFANARARSNSTL